jgi:hypothetical protein
LVGRGAAAVAGGVFAAAGCAGPRAIAPGMHVVWTRADRAYVTPIDSLTPADGDSLTFFEDGSPIAGGIAGRPPGEDLAVVRLTGGSLRGVKRLQRLEVRSARATLWVPRRLRVGFPGPGRASLLFSCPGLTLAAGPGQGGPLARERLSDRSYRFLPDSGAPRGEGLWPDTLVASLFDESTDEEIALERGDLDIAVFWPGELSPHMRDQARWRGFVLAARSTGVVGAVEVDSVPLAAARLPDPVRRALASLNPGVFRGDLAPFLGAGGADSAAEAPPSDGARFEVDHRCPGWDLMERALDRGDEGRAGPGGGARIRVMYLDAPAGDLSAVAARAARYVKDGRFSPALVARADSLLATYPYVAGAAPAPPTPAELWDAIRFVPLYAVRCPVVCDPALRTYARALGPRLVGMLRCGPEGGGP